MTNKRTTKRALLLSVLALVLAITMLMGTTYAWFTDSVSSVNNIIKSGSLDVELEYYNGSAWTPVGENTIVFSDELWEPGHTEVVYLKVSNLGSLALKYSLNVNIASEVPGTNVYGESFNLSDYIYYGAIETATENFFSSRDAARVAAGEGTQLSKKGYTKVNSMGSKTEEYVTMVVYMPETVDNKANAKVGTAEPVINLGINLYATQYTSEEDSFDKYYDGGATWLGMAETEWYDANPNATEFTIGSSEELAGLAKLVNTGVDSFAGKTVKLISDLDLNNIEWTPIGDADADVFVGFKGTFDGQGHTIANLYINSTSWGKGLFGYMDASTNATIKNVKVQNADITATDNCGVIVGYAANGTFSNISITGDVSVVGTAADGYVGGIAGCGYNATFENCSVVANAGSEIVSGGSYAGGIAGYQCNNTKTFKNCSVEGLTITGKAAVGGISGIVQTGGAAIDNCTVKNVVLNMTRVDGNPAIGALVGNYSGTAATTLTGKVENVTLNGAHIAYSAYNVLYGSNYSGATTPDFDVTGVTGTDTITNNLAVATVVNGAGEFKTALTGGANYIYAGGKNVGNLNYGLSTASVPAGKTLVIDSADFSNNGASYGNQINGTVIFENCIFDADVYSIHFDGGSGKVIFNNCTIKGWSSFGSVEVEMNNCTIEGNGKYALIRCYKNAAFNNCTFDLSNADFTDGYADRIDCGSANPSNTITITGCTNVNGEMADICDSKAVSKGAIIIK